MRRIRLPTGSSVALVLVACMLPLSACGGSIGPEDPAIVLDASGVSTPNLLLVTLDTVRADHLGAYGGPPGASPAFDRLAMQGVLYEQCDSPSPLTLPAHASLLTGLEPSAHGLRANGGGRLTARAAPLAALLRAAGRRTAAFVSSAVLDRATGLDRGFDLYDDRMDAAGERRGDRTVERALAWLAAGGAEPWFLWVHLYDAHSPYAPPEAARARFPSQAYRAEIAFADEQLGRLIGAIPFDTTRVAVVADHGEGLGEHGEREHGLLLYQSTLHVPLVLAGPGLPPGERVASPARAQDLFATLVVMAGLVPPEDAPTALLPGLRGGGTLSAGAGTAPTQRSETLMPMLDYGWQPLVAARQGRFKLLRGGFDELFDLETDPDERQNLLGAPGGVAATPEGRRAHARLARDLEVAAPTLAGTESPAGVDADRLRSLGYLGGQPGIDGGAPPDSSVQPGPARPDPRRRVDWHESVADVLLAYRSGHYEEALARLSPLLRQEPDNLLLADLAGSLLVALDRPREAIARYESVLARLPGRAAVRLHLAEALLRAGEHRRAVDEARRALDEGVARRSRAALVLCDALVALGRAAEARAAAAPLLDRIPLDDPLRAQVAACAGG